MTTLKRFFGLALFAALALSLVGAAPAVAQEKPVRIGYVVHVTGIEFTAIVEQGARDAAADYNAELVFTGPPAIDHPAQIAAFDALLETDLDGIVFIAGDPSVWEEPVRRALDKGVVVLTADADAPNTARQAFFGVDALGLGRMLGEKTRELVGDTGKIVLGECVIGPEPHVLRENGFRAAFEGTGVSFVGPFETICDATQNFTNWQSAFTANQDAAALVGLTAVETPSLGRLKQEVGGQFVVSSFDPGAEGLRQMIDGYIDVTVGQNPYLAGYLPVQAIVRHVREGLAIREGVNLYPGELILPADAPGLIEREGGGQPRTDWYRKFIAENNLKDFGLVVPQKPVRIGYVVHVTGIEFTAIVEQGARDAAADYNAELVFTGPPAIDHPAQIAAFDALLETDLDGIVFIAGDPSVWEEPVRRALDKGVVVLTADADAPNTARQAFFGVDALGLGRMLGEKTRELVGDTGKIVLGECVIGPEPHVLRENGFRAAFEGTGVSFVGPFETICDATQNFTNWQSAFTANQDAAALVGLTAVETPSLGRLKQEVGGQFVVSSFDPGAEGLRQMIDGYIDVTVGQNPYLAGYLPVQAIVRHVREGLAIREGVNLYPGELILPADAPGLIEREGGGQPRTDWYRKFIAENNLKDFGLVTK